MVEIATTTMSSKGQVVIPDKIRDLLHLKQGTEFVVLSSEGAVILKPIFLLIFLLCLAKQKKKRKKRESPNRPSRKQLKQPEKTDESCHRYI